MKSKALYITLTLIIIIGGGVIFGLKHMQKEASTLGQMNTQYQNEWRAIDSNIESFNNITKLLAESYGEKTSQKDFHNEAIENAKNYNEIGDKLKKFQIYNENKNIVFEINDLVSSQNELKDNELISKSLINANRLSKTIDEQVKSYNKVIKKYNSIVGNKAYSLFIKNQIEQDILK